MLVRQKHYRQLFRLSLLVVIVNLAACGLLGGNRMDCSPDMLSMLKIMPPSGTKTVSESCSMGINPTYKAVYTIIPADLSMFQQVTAVTDWKLTPDDAVSFKHEAVGLKTLLFGSFGNGVISEEVLIDTGNPEQYTVYFERTFVD